MAPVLATLLACDRAIDHKRVMQERSEQSVPEKRASGAKTARKNCMFNKQFAVQFGRASEQEK